MKCVALMVVVMALAAGATASAQTPLAPGSVFVAVNGMFQAGSNDFEDTSTFRENVENGSLTVEYTVPSGPAFDLAGGVVFWRNLAAAVGVTRFSHSTDTLIRASIPHPFFFSQPRTVEGTFEGDREELAVHVQLRALFPVSDRAQVSIFGGPSFFSVTQAIVNDFDYTDSYPFDTATFTGAVSIEQSESAVGFNIGGDFAYFFTANVGVGATGQYSAATVEMAAPSGTADVEAGGFQVGGGLRLRF